MEEVVLKVYAIRNKDGQWYRSKGYSGYGSSWVNDLKKAKIYPKIGSARAQVTFWAKNYPSYGVPELIEFEATISQVINEEARIYKASVDKQKRKLSEEKEKAKRTMEMAKAELEKAQRRLERLEK